MELSKLHSAIFTFFFLACSCTRISAQQRAVYAIAPAGLNMRALAGDKEQVMTKIAYGAKLQDLSNDDTAFTKEIIIGGLPAHWKKVKYRDTTGYVIDAFLAHMPPPKAGTKDLAAYLLQVAQPFGNKLEQKEQRNNINDNDLAVSRQLYRNGMVYSIFTGYEYIAETLQLPDEDIIVVYNLLKNIEDLRDILKAAPDLKEGTSITKDKNGEPITWTLTYHKEDNMRWLQSIRITWTEGAFYVLELQRMETEVIVTYSSGV